jgi:hypothetical protein
MKRSTQAGTGEQAKGAIMKRPLLQFLGQVSHGGRIRVILPLAFGAALLVAPGAGAGGQAGYGCPPGFNLGAQSLESYLQLPRTQAAIADGLTTEEEVAAGFSAKDRNADGYLCVQLSEGFQKYGPYSVYYYNVVDDNASVPTG